VYAKKRINELGQRLSIILILGFCACSNTEAELSIVVAADNPPVQQVENGRFQYTEKGKTQHVLKAGILNRIEGGSAERPEDLVTVEQGFELFIGGDELQWEAHMQAQNGWLDEKNLRLVAENQVMLRNNVGDLLETEYLVWAEDSDRVWTNRPVTISNDQGVIYGKGLESDGRFENYRILQPSGEIELEGVGEASN